MNSYLSRKQATGVLRDQGVPIGNSGLANMASDGTGPEYVIINGRALYTREKLAAWIDQQERSTTRP